MGDATHSNKIIINEIIGRCLEEIQDRTGAILDARVNGRIISIYENHPENSNLISLKGIEEIVIDTLHLDNPNALKSKDRNRDYVDGRTIFCHISRKYHFTLTTIAKFLKKDHTTIIHHVKKSLVLLEVDPVFTIKHSQALQKINDKYGKIVY